MASPVFAGDGNTLVLDYTQARSDPDLTSQVPRVYRPGPGFDPSKFSAGEIPRADFEGLVRDGLIPPKGVVRFKVGKGREVVVYIVTSMRMDTLEQAVAPAAPPLQWASEPITFVAAHSSRASGPVTTTSRPMTLSILRTARFLLQERQRPTALQSGGTATASSVFGVAFKEAVLPAVPGVYYYYRQNYRLKFENSTLSLSFEDQSGNQLKVATVVSGPPENWFLTAGGPLYAFNPGQNAPGIDPTGLYVGLNWTPNDIFDPDARLLIVNLLDVNTTNPASAVGLIGLGMGFPKMADFIPLSTLSVTETLAYNLGQSRFQWLTMVSFDVTDVLQLLKL